MLPEKNIDVLIPQKPPFTMIDELVFSDAQKTCTAFRIPEDNIFVEEGLFLEPGLVENIAQTAAARAGYLARMENQPVPLGFIGAVKNLEIYALPHVHDLLETEICISNQVFDVTIITGQVTCNSRLLARLRNEIVIPKNQ
jgi:predicted hotdog family 3-hydroxylacyl-ACP dehydratase